MPDVVVTTGDLDRDLDTLAVVEVEVAHRTMHRLIRVAAEYLHGLSRLEAVLMIQFFPVRVNDHQELRVPALAVAFCRGNSGIRVAQMCSFGNAPIDPSLMEAFMHPPTESLLEPYPAAVNCVAPAPGLPECFHVATLVGEMMALRQQTTRELLKVALPATLPSI